MSSETVLVTGASSGIGLELAKCFAASKARLVLVARNRNALMSLAEELRKTYKTNSEVLAADLSQPEAPARIFNHLQTNGTKVDVLVNNAGFGAYGKFFELPLERQLQMIQVNVTALAHLTRLFLPGMLKARRGGIMNIASTAAFAAGPGMAVYYATKAFVLSFSEAVSEEIAGSGVTVSAVCPGATITNFGEAAQMSHSRLFRKSAMSAPEVARIGYAGFRAGRAVVVTGVRNRVMAVSTRFAPRVLVRKVVKRLNRASYD
jgi:short-subunit dehydrogenase